LETILQKYEAIEYRILFATSPDIDVIYYDSVFKEYVMEYPDDNIDIDELAVKYAKEKGFEKVVVLFDGYEQAVAIVREKGE
ncbi:MAG: hypothetical protein JHC26_11650, partial [Thermofilum sp.]|uniref:hypothetical protein n=1 Tax=Thermofilum sp. TaxID=1961369 RepID=UPI002587B2AB